MSNVIYMRGDFGGPFGLRGEYAARADLRHVANLSRRQIQAVVEASSSTEGFLSRQGLSSIVTKHVEDIGQAEALTRAIWNLSGRAEDGKHLLKAVRENTDEPLTDTQIAIIEDFFRQLAVPIPSIERWRKADRVEKLTGVKVQDLQLVADMRPVFDDQRERIDAIIPTVTLRVVWESESGMPEAIEAHLTRKQIADLSEKLQHLEKKLSAVDTFVAEKQLAVPDLGRLSQEEQK